MEGPRQKHFLKPITSNQIQWNCGELENLDRVSLGLGVLMGFLIVTMVVQVGGENVVALAAVELVTKQT